MAIFLIQFDCDCQSDDLEEQLMKALTNCRKVSSVQDIDFSCVFGDNGGFRGTEPTKRQMHVELDWKLAF
jgi:hypothetical protein